MSAVVLHSPAEGLDRLVFAVERSLAWMKAGAVLAVRCDRFDRVHLVGWCMSAGKRIGNPGDVGNDLLIENTPSPAPTTEIFNPPTNTKENTMSTTTTTAGTDSRVLIGLGHGAEEPENVLIAYLMGVEALRAGKEAVLWLTKSGVEVAVDDAVDEIVVAGAPSLRDLHDEFVEAGGRLFACPVCVKLRDLTDATWAKNVEVVGAPSVYDFTAGGALVFNY